MNQTARTQDMSHAGKRPLGHALETLTRLSNRSGEQVQHGLIEASVALTQAAGSLLEEARSQSAKVARWASRSISPPSLRTAVSPASASGTCRPT